MKNRKVGNDLLARGDPRADSIILSELAKWLSALARPVLLSCVSACVGVGAIPDGTQTALSWVSPTSHLCTELEHRGKSCLILPETCQHAMASCHAEHGVLAHWVPVPAGICTIHEHHFSLWVHIWQLERGM